MPVADDGQDQDQPGDHQQTRRFQGIDLRRAVMFEGRVIGRAWIRLPFWTRCRHTHIVAPESRVACKNVSRRRACFTEPP
jgi:hypothetical protein